MSRTSIPCDDVTKDRLDRLKSDDETWDEFLRRLSMECGDGMEPGSLADEDADEMREIVRRGRER